jgi:hypothetical protein
MDFKIDYYPEEYEYNPPQYYWPSQHTPGCVTVGSWECAAAAARAAGATHLLMNGHRYPVPPAPPPPRPWAGL